MQLDSLGQPVGFAVPNIGNTPIKSLVGDSTELEPLNTHVFVRPDDPVEKVGALFVPPTSTTQCTGTVVASDSPLCKPGDRVVYSRFWPFTFDGQTHVCCMGKDLVGIKRQKPAAVADA